jgi:hypothetical protein
VATPARRIPLTRSHGHARPSSADRRTCTSVLEADPGPSLLSPVVPAEIDHLLARRVGVDAELASLREVAADA